MLKTIHILHENVKLKIIVTIKIVEKCYGS